MSEPDQWVDVRLAAAISAATTIDHVFPDAVAAELRKLLCGALQDVKKPADLDVVATSLIAANRGEK